MHWIYLNQWFNIFSFLILSFSWTLKIRLNNFFPYYRSNQEYSKPRFKNLPLSTACPKEQWREGTSWANLESFLIKEDLLEGRGGSNVWELRLSWCSSSVPCIRGFVTEGSVSGVCLLVKDVERNELLNLDNEGVPKNPMFGDGTLLYRSIDCLKHHQSQQ